MKLKLTEKNEVICSIPKLPVINFKDASLQDMYDRGFPVVSNKEEYSYQVNDTDSSRYDIFKVGGEIVAKSITSELVEKICNFLNK